MSMERKMLKQQRFLLVKRLDVLSENLKTANDSEAAEEILTEMRNIGELLKELTVNPVADEFVQDARYKIYGARRSETG